MLKQRIMTATVLIALFLALILWAPFFYVAALFLLVMLLGAWEWGRLIQLSLLQRSAYLFLLVTVCLGCLYGRIDLALPATIFWGLVLILLVVLHRYPCGVERLKTLMLSKPVVWKCLAGLAGLVVLAPAWGSLVSLGQQREGVAWILAIFLLVWTADIAAYFCGKAWGKHKLSIVLSPGKSWEGVLGGMVCVVLAALPLAFFVLSEEQSKLGFILLCAIIAVISVVGDLFQSLLKRVSGVKDSGQLLPGHGGILDRIDSITAAAPVFALGLTVLGSFCG